MKTLLACLNFTITLFIVNPYVYESPYPVTHISYLGGSFSSIIKLSGNSHTFIARLGNIELLANFIIFGLASADACIFGFSFFVVFLFFSYLVIIHPSRVERGALFVPG